MWSVGYLSFKPFLYKTNEKHQKIHFKYLYNIDLLIAFVSKCKPFTSMQYLESFILILNDYNNNIMEVRDQEVILFFALIVEKYNLLIKEKM